MCFQLRDALKLGNIALYKHFFSLQMDEREALNGIRDELTRFSIVVEPAKTLFGKVCNTRSPTHLLTYSPTHLLTRTKETLLCLFLLHCAFTPR